MWKNIYHYIQNSSANLLTVKGSKIKILHKLQIHKNIFGQTIKPNLIKNWDFFILKFEQYICNLFIMI